MSTENEAEKCKQSFKGVENFLRRVAFNLGNTPSQTEVKIISCIPIDVTDLQQKIIQLERQLEDAKTTSIKEATKSIKSAKNGKAANESLKHAAETKENDEIKLANKTKEFNKANQPNGVKSSNGAKQSDAAKLSDGNQKANETQKRASAIHTALCKSTFPEFSNGGVSKGVEYCQSNRTVQYDDCTYSSKHNKSAASYTFPTDSTIRENYTYLSTKHSDKDIEEKFCSPQECRRNFFRMKNKQPKKKKIKTQMVYYAQTSSAPFNSYEIPTRSTFKDVSNANSNLISRSYLSDMIRKQYKPVNVTDRLSETSQFSSPVCRDVEQSFLMPLPNESDACSCCHGNFQNIDNYITSLKCNPVSNCEKNVNDRRNTYYDSSLYDLVPVKEKSVKTKKEVDVPKRKEQKVDIRCWPENVRAKSRPQPIMLNYHTVIPARDDYIMRHTPSFVFLKRDVNKLSAKRTRNINKLDQQTGMESSKSCCVDFDEYYPQELPKFKPIKVPKIITPSLNNAEYLTTVVNNTHCQTTTMNIEKIKTEETLNQIKNILQTVLMEVKTKSQSKDIEDNTKKDAVVQKGASQNHMQEGSSLMNSFTYSPYNINPHGPLCSRQMATNHFCYYGLSNTIKTSHKYPLLIHTPAQNMCTSCFRNSQYKAHNIKNATTATTNTDEIHEQRSKVTDKLIKEIYKSIALDIPTKDTSLSDYDDLKSVENSPMKNSNPLRQEKEDKQIILAISEIFRNPDAQKDSSVTRETNTPIQTNFISDIVSSRSQSASTNPVSDRSKHKMNKTFINKKGIQQTTEINSETNDIARYHLVNSSIDTTESSDSEKSISDTESDDTIKPLKEFKDEKKKEGFFRKVFQLFNKTKKKKQAIQVETELEKSEESDSDSYQTVYSQKIEIPQHTEHPRRKARPHTKILHSKPRNYTKRSTGRFKRIPYMEQEYRRHWNEKLMFHDNQNGRRYSSEQPFSKETTPRIRQQQVYCQNYEARSVLVAPPGMCQQKYGATHDHGWNTNKLGPAIGNTHQTVNSPLGVNGIAPPAVNVNTSPAVNANCGPPTMNCDDRNGSRLRQNWSPITNYETRGRLSPQNILPTEKLFGNQIRQTSYNMRNRLDPQIFPPVINNGNQNEQHNMAVGNNNPILGKRALKGLCWLKKNKLGIHCGEQWKKFILEN